LLEIGVEKERKRCEENKKKKHEWVPFMPVYLHAFPSESVKKGGEARFGD